MIAANHSAGAAESDKIPAIAIVLSMGFALLLAIWPLPSDFKWFRPEFSVLVLFFWMRVWSFRLGLVFAWIAGLTFDLLRGDIACQSALGMTLVAYLILVFYAVIRRATLVTEMLIISGLMLVYLMAGFWVMAIAGERVWRLEYFYVILTTTLFWPLARWFMQRLFVR